MGGADDGAREGVLAVGLGRGGEREELIGGASLSGGDVGDGRFALREGAGLVEEDGVDTAHALQGETVLDEHAAAGGALYYYGPPSWMVAMGLVPEEGDPDLLFYLSKPAERRKLPTGEEYFAFGARIVNSGTQALPVPPVLVQLRDRQNRLVFSWTTKADKTRLKPGEEASINESRIDIPKNAENLSLTFVQ